MPPRSANARQTAAAHPGNTAPAAGARALRFVASAHEHTEVITTKAYVPGAAAIADGPFDVTPYGFFRHVAVEVWMTGGTIGTAVVSADFPWNIFQSIYLQDVNGSNIFGPMDGYAWYVACKYGGYAYRQDPVLSPIFANGAISAVFVLRVPVELARHSAMGALANQNAATTYKLGWTINTSAAIWTTAPTAVPTVNVKAHLEAWSQPNETDVRGRPQAVVPPLHGASQYWNSQIRNTVNGNNTIPITRVGNLIRVIAIVARDGTGARNDAAFFDPFTINWDAKMMMAESQRLRQHKMGESLEAPAARETGVYVLFFNNIFGGRAGDDNTDLWLSTLQSTRLEVVGNSTTAGALQFLINDVTGVETDPTLRYVEDNAGAFHPAT